MSRIHSLKIKNFRGIKHFEEKFWNDDLICFIGRGGSGKTTLIEAISFVLYPSYGGNLFSDGDFNNYCYDEDIIIEAVIGNLPDKFIKNDKFGKFLTYINKDGCLDPEASNKKEADHIAAIRIRLTVNKNLDCEWVVVNPRSKEEKKISYYTRRSLGVYLISDYQDFHFIWGKSSPLYSLTQKIDEEEIDEHKVISSIRDAVKNIKNETSGEGELIGEEIKAEANKLGVGLGDLRIHPETERYLQRGSAFTLHDDNLPVTLKGKGSKRLISIAIQKALSDKSGIILIDEIEQGLEPDRIKHLIRTFQSEKNIQKFITTHSQNVIEELGVYGVFLLKKEENKEQLKAEKIEENKLALIRKCPEAFYADHVLVCEGKTEIGICRAVESELRGKETILTSRGVVYTEAGGDEDALNKAMQLRDIMPDSSSIAVFCDSDNDDKNNIKELKRKLRDKKDVRIIDHEEGKNIEDIVFEQITINELKKITKYTRLSKEEITTIEKADHLKEIKEKDWWEDIAERADNKSWFKRIGSAEFLGTVLIGSENSWGFIEELEKWIKEKIDAE